MKNLKYICKKLNKQKQKLNKQKQKLNKGLKLIIPKSHKTFKILCKNLIATQVHPDQTKVKKKRRKKKKRRRKRRKKRKRKIRK